MVAPQLDCVCNFITLTLSLTLTLTHPGGHPPSASGGAPPLPRLCGGGNLRVWEADGARFRVLNRKRRGLFPR
eukprot:scaffold117322_cov48-Phaeocystis_antarctica.AAC.2